MQIKFLGLRLMISVAVMGAAERAWADEAVKLDVQRYGWLLRCRRLPTSGHRARAGPSAFLALTGACCWTFRCVG